MKTTEFVCGFHMDNKKLTIFRPLTEGVSLVILFVFSVGGVLTLFQIIIQNKVQSRKIYAR